MGAHGAEGDGGCVCEGLTVRKAPGLSSADYPRLSCITSIMFDFVRVQVRGKHWLVFDTVDRAHAARRVLSEHLNFPPLLAFAPAASIAEVESTAAAATGLVDGAVSGTFSALSQAHSPLLTLAWRPLPWAPSSHPHLASPSHPRLASLGLTFPWPPPLLTLPWPLPQALPPNLKLVTLTSNYEAFNNGQWMLRLSHLYQARLTHLILPWTPPPHPPLVRLLILLWPPLSLPWFASSSSLGYSSGGRAPHPGGAGYNQSAGQSSPHHPPLPPLLILPWPLLLIFFARRRSSTQQASRSPPRRRRHSPATAP